MIKWVFFYCMCILAAGSSRVNGQLFNNGGTITIETGALLLSTGNVNNLSGILNNKGRLEVQGNFLNNGTYTSATADDSLIFSGAGNATLNPGAALLTHLWIKKATAADEVKLAAPTTVISTLVYEQGNFTTDPLTNPAFQLSAPVTAQFNFGPGKEITGKVRRIGWVNGQPVIFHQPHMQVQTLGGISPSEFTVTMIPQGNGGDPTQNEREVKRKFQFAPVNGTGYTADIRFPYAEAELNTNTETNLAPWQLINTEWNGRLSPLTRDVAANYVATTGLTANDLTYEWKLADPSYTFNLAAQLKGASNGVLMTTGLNSSGMLNASALNQPYTVAPFNYTGTESVAAGFFSTRPSIVDWILVEYRKPATGLPADALSSTIIGRKAGFITSNGAITDLDGVSPLSMNISKQGQGFIVVRHRNHLGVMSTAIPSNAAGTFARDFSVLSSCYVAPGAASPPVVLLADGIHYGLWAGDVNGSGTVNAADITDIKNAISVSAAGYLATDANLGGTINGTDVSLVKQVIAATGTGSTPARTAGGILSGNGAGRPQSNIPGNTNVNE